MLKWLRSALSGSGRRGRAARALLLLALPTVLLSATLFSADWFLSHESYRYPILLELFRDAVAQGHWYPRWFPDLFGGYGYPTFTFYQPGLFFFALPWSLLPGFPGTALKLAVWALFVLGGTGVYRLARLFCDRAAAVGCAALFLVTPYVFVDLYVRGDLSELGAMLLSPWPLYFGTLLKRCIDDRRRAGGPMAGLAASLAAVVYFHPAVALFAFAVLPLLLAYQGWRGSARASFEYAWRLGACLAGALACSAPYWFTVFQMEPYVDLALASKGDLAPARNLVAWPRYFSCPGALSGALLCPDGSMAFPLGPLHAALATVGVVVGRRVRLVQASFAACAVLLVLMAPPVGRWFWSLPWGLLQKVQFPWRMLSIVALLQVVCAFGVARHRRGKYAIACGVLLAVGWHHDAFRPTAVGEGAQAHVAAQRASPSNCYCTVDMLAEYLPRWAKSRTLPGPRGRSPDLVAPAEVQVAPLAGNSAFRLRYEVRAPRSSQVTVNQLYFPGFHVVLNGVAQPPQALQEAILGDGRMTVTVPEGVTRVEIHYDGPPGWRWRTAICIALLVGFAALCVREHRRGTAAARA